jgi:hypothetical protein
MVELTVGHFSGLIAAAVFLSMAPPMQGNHAFKQKHAKRAKLS